MEIKTRYGRVTKGDRLFSLGRDDKSNKENNKANNEVHNKEIIKYIKYNRGAGSGNWGHGGRQEKTGGLARTPSQTILHRIKKRLWQQVKRTS
jgi:hypothetical protein